MKLQDQLYDAVADVSADLPALAAASRRRGLAIRRRRHALATVGIAAVVLAVAGAGLSVRPGPGGQDLTDSAFAVISLNGQTAPNTGRTTAAALTGAVAQVTDGTFSGFVGQGTSSVGATRGFTASYGYVFVTPAAGGPGGGVSVNLQALPTAKPCGDDNARRCTTTPSDACTGTDRVGCTSTTLANGDTLSSYDVRQTPGTTRIYRFAVLVSPSRHLRIAAVATNMDWDERVTRPDAILGFDQLRAVVSQPWWGLRLPVEYAEVGRHLPSYRDVSYSGPTAASSPSSPDAG